MISPEIIHVNYIKRKHRPEATAACDIGFPKEK